MKIDLLPIKSLLTLSKKMVRSGGTLGFFRDNKGGDFEYILILSVYYYFFYCKIQYLYDLSSPGTIQAMHVTDG